MSKNYFKAPSGKVVTQWPYGNVPYRMLTKLLGRVSETTRVGRALLGPTAQQTGLAIAFGLRVVTWRAARLHVRIRRDAAIRARIDVVPLEVILPTAIGARHPFEPRAPPSSSAVRSAAGRCRPKCATV